jgi:hypothetical protein
MDTGWRQLGAAGDPAETPDLEHPRDYAVWVPFLAGTQQAADVSQRVLPDPRVDHYWDGEAATSDWFAENVEHSFAPAWDVYYLYGPDASW